MVIMVIGVASVKSSIGIFTHQGYISKVNANDHSVSYSVSKWLSSLLERLVTLKKKTTEQFLRIFECWKSFSKSKSSWNMIKATTNQTVCEESCRSSLNTQGIFWQFQFKTAEITFPFSCLSNLWAAWIVCHRQSFASIFKWKNCTREWLAWKTQT